MQTILVHIACPEAAMSRGDWSRSGYVPKWLVPKWLCPEVTGPEVAMSRGDWSRSGYVPRWLVPKWLCPEVTGPEVAMSRSCRVPKCPVSVQSRSVTLSLAKPRQSTSSSIDISIWTVKLVVIVLLEQWSCPARVCLVLHLNVLVVPASKRF